MASRRRVSGYPGHSIRDHTYQGVSSQRKQVDKDIVVAFINYLPEAPFAVRLAEIEENFDRSCGAAIGEHGEDSFCYRVQSPIVVVEFDHHTAIWLINLHSAKRHTQTIVLTTNGNDYDKDRVRQHYEHAHP